MDEISTISSFDNVDISSGDESDEDDAEDFGGNVHEHDATPLVGVGEVSTFGDRDALAAVPPSNVNVAVNLAMKVTHITINLDLDVDVSSC